MIRIQIAKKITSAISNTSGPLSMSSSRTACFRYKDTRFPQRHSITSSARTSSDWGTFSPIERAVRRLMAKVIWVGS